MTAADLDKVRAKLQFIREATRQLEQIRGRGRDCLLADPILQAAALRNLQVGIEAMLDIAHAVIAREGLGLPGTYREAIEILLRHGMLPDAHAAAFLSMASFRNRLVHLYDTVEPAEIAKILDQNLGDFAVFISAITERYLASPNDPGGQRP
jgi:uncharacterized protein YutE (UPF0331/DUF86 family)